MPANSVPDLSPHCRFPPFIYLRIPFSVPGLLSIWKFGELIAMSHYTVRVEINIKFSQCLVFMYLLSFRQLTKELQDVLAQDPYPKTRLPNSNLPDSILRSLNQFGLVTHGFGSPAINAAMNAFQAYLGELLKLHEGNVPSSGNTGGRNQNIVKNGEAWLDVIYYQQLLYI